MRREGWAGRVDRDVTVDVAHALSVVREAAEGVALRKWKKGGNGG